MSRRGSSTARALLVAAFVLVASSSTATAAAAGIPFSGRGKHPGTQRVNEGAVRVAWRDVHPPGCKPLDADTSKRWCELDDDGVITVRNPVRFDEVMKLEDKRHQAMVEHPDADAGYLEHEIYNLAKAVRAGRAATNALKRATDKFDAAERDRLRSPGVKKAPKNASARKRRVVDVLRCRKDWNPNSEAAGFEKDTGWGYVCSVNQYKIHRAEPTTNPEAKQRNDTDPATGKERVRAPETDTQKCARLRHYKYKYDLDGSEGKPKFRRWLASAHAGFAQLEKLRDHATSDGGTGVGKVREIIEERANKAYKAISRELHPGQIDVDASDATRVRRGRGWNSCDAEGAVRPRDGPEELRAEAAEVRGGLAPRRPRQARRAVVNFFIKSRYLSKKNVSIVISVRDLLGT